MHPDKKFNRARGLSAAALAFITAPLWLSATSEPQDENPLPIIAPQIPNADRSSSDKVFLEHADVLHKQTADSFMVLTGNVEFRKGGMSMYCDSAHFYSETEAFDAFGNVRMEQGDTLFVYADTLKYRSLSQLGFLWGDPVRMINKDVTLKTDEFIYDFQAEYGYYEVGGTLIDNQNVLVSRLGNYVPATKEASFFIDVKLNSLDEKNDSMVIYTDTLYYNTDTHIAELFSPSEVINKRDTIFTSHGVYDTNTEVARLYDRSLVRMGRGTTLEGDTLFYDKAAGYGWARGNMEIVDIQRQSTLTGNYGYYSQIEDSAYVTGRALAKEYSQGDTLFVHGREIFSKARFDTVLLEADTIMGLPERMKIDTFHVIYSYPRVRFYRTDMQGVCDTMRFEEKDSTLYMLKNPIVWSGGRQIFGNEINVHLNDSTIDRAWLPKFGFSAELIEEGYFNQLSGKEMVAYFNNGDMRRLDVNGNVEAIMFPMENDSTYNKVISMQSSFLTANFENRQLLRMKTWPETTGAVTPLYLAKRSIFYLPNFKWFEGIRPTSPEDVFIVPPAMEELMGGTPIDESPEKESLQAAPMMATPADNE
ncbi:MAG: hypothetical protein NC102_08055 [Clostridium sp.]|nr:hypothetical protein [Clostridium sp.]